MTRKPTRTYCEDCGKEVMHSSQKTQYCPDCGAEDSWVDEPRHDMDDVDLPVIVEREHYDDSYGLWRDFVYQVFGASSLTEDDIANVPDDFPKMKYCCPITFWVVCKDSVEGPYLNRSDAREYRDAKSEVES